MPNPSAPDAGPPATPRWVKALAVAAIVIAAVALALLLTGGHGPGMHGG